MTEQLATRGTQGTPASVLLIDDDPFLTGIYRLGLERAGYVVTAAASGNDGLKIAQSGKPDVILLDLLMPQMDGFEVMHRLGQHRSTKGIPVIILSTLSQQEDIQRALDAGAKGYLVKSKTLPFEAPLKVREVLGR